MSNSFRLRHRNEYPNDGSLRQAILVFIFVAVILFAVVQMNNRTREGDSQRCMRYGGTPVVLSGRVQCLTGGNRTP